MHDSFLIDGSDLLRSLRMDGGGSSVRALAALLAFLDREFCRFLIWFEPSPEIEVGGDVVEFQSLLCELQRDGVCRLAPESDAVLSDECQRLGAGLINGSERPYAWAPPGPPIFRARVQLVLGGNLVISLGAAAGGVRRLSQPLFQPFRFRSMVFRGLRPLDPAPKLGRVWAEPVSHKGPRASGRLLLFLVDLSAAMARTDTFDRRSRGAHVAESLRSSFTALSKSREEKLLVAVLGFSNRVRLISASGGGGVVFAPCQAWEAVPLRELLDCEPAEGGTNRNWRLALDSAAELIQGFRSSEIASSFAVNWRAHIITLAGAAHCNTADNGASLEGDHKHAPGCVSWSLHGVPKVSVTAIALGGSDSVHLAFSDRATEHQVAAASRNGFRLEGEPARLVIAPDVMRPDFGTTVRAFVELATNSL